MLKYYNIDIPICQSQIESIYCDTSQSRKAVPQANAKPTTMSDAIAAIAANTDIECSGVFCQQIRETQPYHNAPNYMSCRGDFHLFAKHRDKVYMEVRNAGEIVISFAELQKNKYWKYYYDLSLLLANDKHTPMIKNEASNAFNKLYNNIYDYKGDRSWTFENAYIDINTDIEQHPFKIIPSGNVCYFKINPADVDKMEYSTQQEIDVFERKYTNSLERIKFFQSRSVIYKNIAIGYQVSKMEKELDELSAFFENKKHIANITAIKEKLDTNIDVLMIIYKNLVDNNKADSPEMIAKIEKAMGAKTALNLISHILAT
jgi:hypothetical protein